MFEIRDSGDSPDSVFNRQHPNVRDKGFWRLTAPEPRTWYGITREGPKRFMIAWRKKIRHPKIVNERERWKMRMGLYSTGGYPLGN